MWVSHCSSVSFLCARTPSHLHLRAPSTHRQHNRSHVVLSLLLLSCQLHSSFSNALVHFALPPSLLLLFHMSSSFSSFLLLTAYFIFHFAALLLITQSACGLTETLGSDGGCQTVNPYLFTNVHVLHIRQKGRKMARTQTKW